MTEPEVVMLCLGFVIGLLVGIIIKDFAARRYKAT